MEIMSARLPRVVLCLAVTLLAASCSEVRGRRQVQEANRLYKDGHYKEAVAAFEEAEKYVPNLPQLWLNKGYTCRQILVPGAKTPESQAAAKCAIEALSRVPEADAPGSARRDAVRPDAVRQRRVRDAGEDVRGAVQEEPPRHRVGQRAASRSTRKWNKLEESLEWYARKAEILSNDAEAQYGAGVFIYTQLFQKGGGPEKSTHDPRPDPNKPREVKQHPGFGPGDIVSQQRVDLADTGIKYLEKAIALRPKYHEAMTYINLLLPAEVVRLLRVSRRLAEVRGPGDPLGQEVVRGQRPARFRPAS